MQAAPRQVHPVDIGRHEGDQALLGRRAAAAGHARQALSAARAAGATPLVLFALSVFAQVIAADDRALARALVQLVSHHPATEYQDRREAAELLALLGPEAAAPPLDLDGALAAVLGAA